MSYPHKYYLNCGAFSSGKTSQITELIIQEAFDQWLEQVASAIGHDVTMSDLQLDRLRHWFEAGYSHQTAAHWIEES